MNTDVVVIGAGPVGLAMAIELKRRRIDAVVIDKGAIVNSLLGYPTNMEFFSTPDLLEIGGHPFPTFGYKPIREEAIDYYRKVAQAENLRMGLYEEVDQLEGTVHAFKVHTSKRVLECRFVVIAAGFFDRPNKLDVPGEDLPKVTHYFKEPYPYSGTRVAVVGGGNSAAKAALQCHRHGAQVTMIVRGPDIKDTVKYWIRPDLVNRIEEGSIRAMFGATVSRIEEYALHIQSENGPTELDNDFVLALTGYHPDFGLMERLGCTLESDDAQTPCYDRDSFQTERDGLYIAGTICGGLKTSTWFIENGRDHARVIANHIAERPQPKL